MHKTIYAYAFRLYSLNNVFTESQTILEKQIITEYLISKCYNHNKICTNFTQVISWPIASALHRSEDLEIQVLAFNRFLNNRLLGSTTFSLHRLIDEPTIQLSASLLDANGRPLKVRYMIRANYHLAAIILRLFVSLNSFSFIS